MAEVSSEDLQRARMLASETEIERIIRERDETMQAIEDEMQAINEKIRDEKDAYADLTTFKINLDNAYQIAFKQNSLEQLSLYDQLIQKANQLR
jgi:hypothetical protein